MINISELPHKDCCGCRACGDVCPAGCISFNTDSEGFFYPKVDESRCVKCGKCVRTCPEINLAVHERAQNSIAAYAASTDARNAGSSGGVFGLLAKAVTDLGGTVWGAAFDSRLKVVHQSATNANEIVPLLRSKYVQSDATGSYSSVAAEVRNGRSVMFSGTPCQCNAVRNVTGDPDNLVTVEVVCHGVPSQQLFDKSIEWLEKRKDCHISSFAFRSKYANALHPQAFSYICERNGNSKRVNGLHYQNPFYFGFQKYITLRPSCYTCPWARPERTADITLGDFWGIEKIDASLDPKTGVSLILVNSTKGKSMIDKLMSEHSIVSKEFPLSAAVDNNGCLSAPTTLKPSRAAFFKALAEEPFDAVVTKFLTPRRKWIFDIYYGLPGPLRRVVRKIMDKRMKYE